MTLNKNDLIKIYRQMLTIRRFEEKVAEFLSQGNGASLHWRRSNSCGSMQGYQR